MGTLIYQTFSDAPNVVLNDIRNVLLINSRSRSGSSLTHQILMQSPPESKICFLQGEINPLIKLSKSHKADDFSSAYDEINLARFDSVMFEALLAKSVGNYNPNDVLSSEDQKLYALDIHDRLTMQWPDLDLS